MAGSNVVQPTFGSHCKAGAKLVVCCKGTGELLRTLLPVEQSPPSTLTSLRPLQQIRRILETSTPNCHRPCSTLSRLASCSGGILAKSTGECWQAAPARYWPDTRQDPPARDTQRDARRDPRASCSGILSGMLSGIHWQAAWWDTRRDPLASYSGRMLGGLLWDTQRYTRRDPLAGCSGGILLARYSAGSTGQLLWRDTGRDALASSSGGILGGIHWRAALAGYSAGSTGEQLWRDTGRDALASSSGGILGGIHSAGSTGWGRV